MIENLGSLLSGLQSVIGILSDVVFEQGYLRQNGLGGVMVDAKQFGD